ncbi:MAG: alpha/beta hydrolase [Dehalococcoidia bacterium]
MTTNTVLRDFQGPAGRLEALLEMPVSPSQAATTSGAGVGPTSAETTPAAPPALKAVVVLGHPHPQFGGTMHTKGLYHTAKGLLRIGCAVLRFNFRGVGKSEGAYDEGRGERDDFRAALDVMAGRHPGVPLWAGGMSFGSWVGMNVGAEDPRVSALIGVAAPVSKWDFEAVAGSPKPKFLVHGELDEICGLKEITAFYSRAADPKELAIIDAADHLFNGKASEVAEAIEDLLADWDPPRAPVDSSHD